MKRFALPLILAVLLISLQAAKYGAMYAGVDIQPVTAAVIVSETKDEPKLSKEIRGVLANAPKHGVRVVDPNVLDKDKKTPPQLKPFFDAVGDKPLPQLVIERGASYESQPCPDSVAKLQEAIK